MCVVSCVCESYKKDTLMRWPCERCVFTTVGDQGSSSPASLTLPPPTPNHDHDHDHSYTHTPAQRHVYDFFGSHRLAQKSASAFVATFPKLEAVRVRCVVQKLTQARRDQYDIVDCTSRQLDETAVAFTGEARLLVRLPGSQLFDPDYLFLANQHFAVRSMQPHAPLQHDQDALHTVPSSEDDLT